jgi:hypothetical protein
MSEMRNGLASRRHPARAGATHVFKSSAFDLNADGDGRHNGSRDDDAFAICALDATEPAREVFDKACAKVTAGLANEVEAVTAGPLRHDARYDDNCDDVTWTVRDIHPVRCRT